MRILPVLSALAALFTSWTSPAGAATYDFTWEATDTISTVGVPSTLAGRGTAIIEPGPQIGNAPTTILRFTGPQPGPLDGLWGGQLVLAGDSYTGGVTYPSAVSDRGLAALGVLRLSDGGFTISGSHWPSGPDQVLGSFRGVGTTRVLSTPEPLSLLWLSLGGGVMAALLRRGGDRGKRG